MRISDWTSDVCSSDLVTALSWRWADAEAVARLRRVIDNSLFTERRHGPQFGRREIIQGTDARALAQFCKLEPPAGRRRRHGCLRDCGSTEERTVGKESVSMGRSRWAPYN